MIRIKYNYDSSEQAFTLTEILVVLALLGVLATFTLFISLDYYRSATLRSERDTVVTILEKARSQSMNNIDQSPHGLHITTSSYILFEGSTWASRAQALDISFPVSGGVTATGNDIIFSQLSGATTAATIYLTDLNGKQLPVSVNTEDAIDW